MGARKAKEVPAKKKVAWVLVAGVYQHGKRHPVGAEIDFPEGTDPNKQFAGSKWELKLPTT